MVLFYASIPVMLLAIAIAVMPLIWMMAHEARRNEFEELSPVTAMSESPIERDRAA